MDHAHPDFRRVPGLFRRWELAELLEPGVDYRIEDAGETDAGARLIALYRRGDGGGDELGAETISEPDE